MSVFKKGKLPEFEDVVSSLKKNSKNIPTPVDIIRGNKQLSAFIGKNMVFVLFIVALGIIYIANRYSMEEKAKTRQALRREIVSLKAEATTTGAELMRLSSRAEIKKEVQSRGLGLNEPTSPPIMLRMSKTNE